MNSGETAPAASGGGPTLMTTGGDPAPAVSGEDPTSVMNGEDPTPAMNGGDLTGMANGTTDGGDPTPAANGGHLTPATNPAPAMNPAPATNPTPAMNPAPATNNETEEQDNENVPKESNWATRNPTKAIIPSRHRPRPKLTEAQLASRAVSTQSKNASRALLMQDVDNYLDELDVRIQEISDKHSVHQEYIRKLINPLTTYKKTRVPTLPNAIAHIKALEVNKGKVSMLKYNHLQPINNTRFTIWRKTQIDRA